MNAHVYDMRGEPMDAAPEVPANPEAEQALLGAILLNNAALQSVPFLDAEHFYEPMHREIFAAIQKRADGGLSSSPVTLKDHLPNERIGDMTTAQYLTRLAVEAVSIAHARDFGLTILSLHGRRLGIARCEDLRKRFTSTDEGLLDIVGDMEDEAAAIRALAPQMDTRSSISGYLDGLLQRLSDRARSEAAVIPFPLPEIGTVLQEDGWEPGNLYGLVAASGEGKTSLVLQIVRAAAEAGHPVLIMSFDQTGEQVSMQMLSQAVGISLGAMRRRGGMNEKEWGMVDDEATRLRKLPIEVKALRQEKIGKIGSIARTFAKAWSKRTDKAPLIILDHNRKVTPDRPNDHEGRIAASVNGYGKALAREIGAAVLYLCQRNGGGLRRDVPRPIAADLFGGEQSREDFDAILTLYRAEKWRTERMKVAGTPAEREKIHLRFLVGGEEPEGLAELGAIKVRYGRDDVTEIVKWEGRFTRYASRRGASQELAF